MRRAVVPAAVLAAVLCTAALASSRPTARAARSGTVSVLFAGSLLALMEHTLGPGFEASWHYGFSGIGGGSTELANEIKGGARRGDVFLSASARAYAALEGRANGAWVSWYTSFMASPLQLAYNPKSRFGRELRRGVPWYRVLTRSGIRVGRTDPALDPKGVLTVEAIGNAARRLHDPALARALSGFETFPETDLLGRLQAGQLDAAFVYAVEAHAARLDTVSLQPVFKYAEYTLTILNGARDPAAAQALVRYLLAPARVRSLARYGLSPIKPVFSGTVAAVPPDLRRIVGAR